MNYYLDTEFHEYAKKPLFGKPINTIELISIGIVSDTGKQYYTISKDFNVKAAWKNEWIRNNVLLPIYKEMVSGDARNKMTFSLQWMRHLIKLNGKSNKEISQEVTEFCYGFAVTGYPIENTNRITLQEINFYAYYADYDWVVFCQLFGRMIDLPRGFPMYCIDLKQELDKKAALIPYGYDVELGLTLMKLSDNYPKNENEHNALADAEWNKRLHKFLLNI